MKSADARPRGWFRESEFEVVLAQAERVRPAGLWRDVRRRFFARRAARWSTYVVFAIVLLSALAPLLPLRSPSAMQLSGEPRAPIAPWLALGDHGFEPSTPSNPFDRALASARASMFGKFQIGAWFGTDALGRDTLARVVWGSRTSLLVALCAALTSLSIGVLWGAIAGLAGARVDNLMMRIVDALQSLPLIFVVIFALSFLDPPRANLAAERGLSREQVFFLVIGAVSWLSMARVVRGQVLTLRKSAFIESARAQGGSFAWILRKHVAPHLLPVVAVYLTLTLPSVILYEAFLSFLGLGVEAPGVSWGLLAADGAAALNPLSTYWWLIAGPSIAIAATLLALGFIGDGLRDALDLAGEAEA